MNRLLGIFAVVFCWSLLACDTKLPNQPDGLYAIIATDHGEMVARLEFEKAPLTVANFVGLAEGEIENTFREKGEPYYDGLTFHRVEKGFVIQGGDPLGTGMGGPGYKFRQEVREDLKHNIAGTLSMAHAGPGTNGSQFFVTHAATPHLDGGYNVFGYLVDGLPVVYKIVPKDTIRKVEIVRKGSAAKNFDAPTTFEQLRDR
jgi:peptidyl-prolyl cis-trans isomerase A (cyclophilin A)